jgi:hypothetical protein
LQLSHVVGRKLTANALIEHAGNHSHDSLVGMGMWGHFAARRVFRDNDIRAGLGRIAIDYDALDVGEWRRLPLKLVCFYEGCLGASGPAAKPGLKRTLSSDATRALRVTVASSYDSSQ